jgi:hypothetical protein
MGLNQAIATTAYVTLQIKLYFQMNRLINKIVRKTMRIFFKPLSLNVFCTRDLT